MAKKQQAKVKDKKRSSAKKTSTPVHRKRIKGKRPVIPELAEKPWAIFDELRAEDDCPYTHVSLFSGCGGFDLGLRAAGFRTVFANDFNESAAETHKHNLGDILVGDIRKVEFPELPRPDLLTAGFPCQPFSNAGLRKGTKDARGDLYLSALKAVKHFNPKTVIFENVRGLLSSKHEGRRVIEIIVENLSELGYSVNFSLVDASKHNVPSQRLRVLIVGVHRDEDLGKFAFPDSVVRPELALKNIIFDIPNEGVTGVKEVITYSPQAESLEKHIPEGGCWRDIPDKYLPERMKKIKKNIVRYHYPRFYQRCDRDEIAGTITASFQPEKAGVFHPTKHRALSVREVARIQSFPDWFEFKGMTSSKYLQIGNAVPPRLAYEIGLQLDRVLKGEDLRTGKASIQFSDFVSTTKVLHLSDLDVVCE